MKNPEQALTERLKELRRRHYGPRGKAELARRLGISLAEYERFERGALPPGDLLVRLCELTGEDLQWLLTGVAARGTVVISGARGRHQALLARLAKLLDERPALAAPVEAFIDLVARGEEARAQAVPALPSPTPDDLIPIYENKDAPAALPPPDARDNGRPPLARLEHLAGMERRAAQLLEPAARYDDQPARAVRLVAAADAEGRDRLFLHQRDIASCFPGMFGVRLTDDSMRPMFRAGDAALVAAGAEPRIGRPVLCKFAHEPGARCRIWLGQDAARVHLGRLADGEQETAARADLAWSLEIIYRLTAA